jgi:hypothetical protein
VIAAFHAEYVRLAEAVGYHQAKELALPIFLSRFHYRLAAPVYKGEADFTRMYVRRVDVAKLPTPVVS